MSALRTIALTLLASILLALPLLAQGRGGGGGGGGGTPPPAADLVGLAPSGSHIKVMKADGTNLRTVVGENCYLTSPALSPDGRQVTYARTQGGVSAIWVVGIDGTGMRAVTPLTQSSFTTSGGIPIRPVWSPVPIAGQHKLLFTDLVGADHQLFVVNLDGSARTQLSGTEPYGVEPYMSFEWSPDATRIVYTTYDPSAWPGPTMVADVAESGGIFAITSWTSLPTYGIVPYWIGWANRSNRLVIGDAGGLGYDLWRFDLDQPGLPVQLTSSPSIDDRCCTFSSDDTRVFYSISGNETWMLNTDGSGTPRRVSSKLFFCYHRRG